MDVHKWEEIGQSHDIKKHGALGISTSENKYDGLVM